MTEEVVERRLSDIEEKIDKLTDLISQTQLQEYRLSVVEQDIKNIKSKVSDLDKRAGNIALKWIAGIGSGIMTILLGYIAVRVGLK